MNKSEMLCMQKALCTAAMPSGFESPQAAIIADFAKSIGCTVQRDVLGNLFCSRNTVSGGGLMIAAAMDVKGFLATHIAEGKVRFQTIGSFEKPEKLVNQPVRFENGVRGVIRNIRSEDGTCGENSTCEEKTAEKKKDVKLEDLYIQIQESAVRTGDAAVLDGEIKELEQGLVQAPHGADLAGCLAVLDAMERLQKDAAAEDVTFVFLAQHQPGRMGLRAAVKRVSPETCILCGGAEAAAAAGEDERREAEKNPSEEKYPVDVGIGAGPVIRFREKLQASDEGTCSRLIRAAEQAGIAWQGEARNRDMSGAIEAMSAGSRPGVGWLGVPIRNAGPFEGVYSMDEVSRCGQVLAALCKLEEEKNRS
ncbi:MAG: hypothetical protein ACI4LJ_05205 [Anaerovoracaceae bacterium]